MPLRGGVRRAFGAGRSSGAARPQPLAQEESSNADQAEHSRQDRDGGDPAAQSVRAGRGRTCAIDLHIRLSASVAESRRGLERAIEK